MGVPGKIAAGAGLAGLMLTLAVVSSLHRRPAAPVTLPAAGDAGPGDTRADMARCRILTTPDADCSATWEAMRRHFFGEDRAQGPTP